MDHWITIAISAVTIIGAWTAFTGVIVWWLSKEFSNTRGTFYSVIDATAREIEGRLETEKKEIMTEVKTLAIKFDGHETLDQERFKSVELGIMRLELLYGPKSP